MRAQRLIPDGQDSSFHLPKADVSERLLPPTLSPNCAHKWFGGWATELTFPYSAIMEGLFWNVSFPMLWFISNMCKSWLSQLRAFSGPRPLMTYSKSWTQVPEALNLNDPIYKMDKISLTVTGFLCTSNKHLVATMQGALRSLQLCW